MIADKLKTNALSPEESNKAREKMAKKDNKITKLKESIALLASGKKPEDIKQEIAALETDCKKAEQERENLNAELQKAKEASKTLKAEIRKNQDKQAEVTKKIKKLEEKK